MPWELARPSGLAVLGLLVPLVLLYVLKIQRRRRRVGSLFLWQAAERDLKARSPFRRLVPLLSLLLEVLALAALALGVANPINRGAPHAATRIALVVDVSASMGTREGVSDRLALAQATALKQIAQLPPGAEVMLIAAGREPALFTAFERDRPRLRTAVARLTVRQEEGRLAGALAMASDQLRQRGGGRLVVITDGALADSASIVAPAVLADWVYVGSPHVNTAIVQSQVARHVDASSGRERVEVFALLEHFGATPRDVFVTVSLRNTETALASRRLTLAAAERTPVVLEFAAAPGDSGQGLDLRLSPEDALASDDHASLRIPLGNKLPVVIAAKNDSPWLTRAFAADPEVELFRADPATLSSATVPDDALLVLDGLCPNNLPGNDLLIVNPPAGACRTVRIGAAQPDPTIISWNESDPRLRFLNLEQVRVSAASQLTTESPGDAIVRGRQGALIADVSSPGRMGTLVGFDVGQSDWPLQASFVLFVRNVAELARAHRVGGNALSARTGEPVAIHVPLDVENVELEYPGGRREQLRAHEGVAVAPAADRVGFLLANWRGARPGSTLVPVNLTSEAESEITPAVPRRIAPSARVTAATTAEYSHYDWLLAAAALALITANVTWLTRRARAAGVDVRGASSARTLPSA